MSVIVCGSAFFAWIAVTAPDLLGKDTLEKLIQDAQTDFVSLFTSGERAAQNYSALSGREKTVLGPIV
ncbi:MAG: hypothetical protein LBR62_02695, partial [Puniceicoccales bacterium]|nr:hypothetical protein [Puniceicoccales bacterium]